MSRLRLQLVAAAVFALAWMQWSALSPRRDSGVLRIDPPTPFDHYIPRDSPIARVLMVHGLNASRQSSQLMAAALADTGFEVYAIDLPGHGDSKAAFQIDRAEEAIRNARKALGEDSIVIGHSLGAGLLLDMAATEHFSTLVLLAAPPIPIDEIHADRVLFATAEFDVPRILQFLPIATDIGGDNAQSFRLAWGAHSSPIFNPRHINRVIEWLGGDPTKTRTIARMTWLAVMLISSVVFGVACLRGRQLPTTELYMKTTLVRYVVGCGVALVTLRFIQPFSWIRLFATDYLIGFLAIAGGVLSLIALYDPPPKSANPIRGLIVAVIAALYVIAVPGWLVASHVLHLSLADGRWWRFPVIAAVGLPIFFADEVLIRRIRPRWKSDTTALLTRCLLLAFILTGVLTLNREHAFLVMLVPVITISWIALWFAAGVVHRHTQSALAAAVFSALVQGWAFAALFVMI